MEKAVVLLSGGLDSTYNLVQAVKEYEVYALSFDYGQRACEKEIATAKRLAQQYKCQHEVVDLSFFKIFTQSSLINRGMEVPTNEVDIDSLSASEKTAEKVWVPNRNGIFLNIAAGFAEGLGAQVVIPGFNKEEAITFPDNSADYCKALEASFSFSTANRVKVKCYSIDMDKTEIVKNLSSEEVDFASLWPCYHNEDKCCTRCESCKRFYRALEANGVEVA